MTIGAILTLGYGSFGSVNLLPTLGYGSGAPKPPNNAYLKWGKKPERRREENEEFVNDIVSIVLTALGEIDGQSYN